MSVETSHQNKLSLRKRLLFSGVLCVGFFLALEGVLALFNVRAVVETGDPYVGFASHVPLYVERKLPDGSIQMVTAQNKLNFFNPQSFPKLKSESAYRIFCVGGSTTYGRPYNDATSYPAWLREILPAIDPSRDWEVVNAGGISYASYREVPLIEELLRYAPDLIVVYTGHNEFLERRTYEGLINANPVQRWLESWMGRTRTFAALQRLAQSAKPDPSGESGERDARYEMTGEVHALLDDIVGLEAYTRDDTLRHNIVEHYRTALQQMAEKITEAGVQTIFVTLPSNLKDISPFKSEHAAGLPAERRQEFNATLEAGQRALREGNLDAAYTSFERALQIDSRYAAAHYGLGQTLFRLGRYDEARSSYLTAIDEDICPLRQLPTMIEIKRDVARDADLPLVDFARIMEKEIFQEFGHRIPGEEYFLDHVHPTIDANRLLALALTEKLIELGVVEARENWRMVGGSKAAQAIESSVDVRMHAAAMRNLAKLFNWAGKTKEATRMAERALELDPTDGQSMVVLGSTAAAEGRSEDAIQLYEQVLQEHPYDMEARLNLAVELSRADRLEESLFHYEELLRRWPETFRVHANIARLYVKMGQLDPAIEHFQEALELRPNDVPVVLDLGTALVRAGRPLQAEKQFQLCLQVDANFAEAHIGLGRVHMARNNFDAASTALAEALRIEPENARAHGLLGIVLARTGDVARAKGHLTQALSTDPNLSEVHNALGMLLWQEGRLQEALSSFEATLRLNPRNLEARNNRAYLLTASGAVREALDEYRAALEMHGDDPMTLNNMAWLMATHSNAEFRDGPEALRLAMKADSLTQHRHPVALSTLAAAHAENGNFDDAIRSVDSAIQIMQQSRQPDAVRDLQSFRRLYEQRQPLRLSHAPGS